MRLPTLLLLSVLVGCTLPLLLRMEEVLIIALPGDLPLGTLLAAGAFLSGNAAVISAQSPGSLLYPMAWLGLAAGAVWLPLGIYLSGNPALSFSGDDSASSLFWRFTLGLGVATCVLLIWRIWSGWYSRRRR
jgi:hypothetical protein